jgi:Phospholipase_D-nuclease N-terminal
MFEPILAVMIMSGLVGLVIFVLDIIALVSVLGGSGSVERKLLWTLVILLLPIVGMIIYFLIGRSGADA